MAMALRTVASFLTLYLLLSPTEAKAEYQKRITGRNPQELMQNAFEAGMDYPTGTLECDQRCSQWWGRENKD